MTPPISARPTLPEAGLDFRRYGYFTRAIPRDGQATPSDPERQRWQALEELIARLERGDFAAAPAVLALCRESRDWRLKTVATRVLGHAGTVECFRDMRAEIEADLGRRRDQIDVATREVILLYSRSFASWGRLDVVPVLMDQYLTLRLKRTPEIALLPLLMADLLVDDERTMIAHEPPEDCLEDYLNLVMERFERLSQQLGSEKVIVFRGALLSVPGLAERMRRPGTSYVASELLTLRERFEPATGTDCSAIFASSKASPLAAADLAERFLDSGAAEGYQPGVRYFFGHPIPD